MSKDTCVVFVLSLSNNIKLSHQKENISLLRAHSTQVSSRDYEAIRHGDFSQVVLEAEAVGEETCSLKGESTYRSEKTLS